MSPLASLVRAYERMVERDEAPAFGFSNEKIGFLIPLAEDGSVVGMPIDLRGGSGKKREARPMRVPQPVKRTSGVASNTFWDKTPYALGVTAGPGKRTAEEHTAFRERHLELFADLEDAGLLAMRRFVEAWVPERFAELGWPEEMKDQNIVFALASEMRGEGLEYRCIHDRPAARSLWARQSGGGGAEAACLVTGERGPIARLHPAVKGVWGAQSSGASLVSFNLDAFTSYGHEQGENAPVSDFAAFAYVTALNTFLEKGSRRRVQIGDASTVFWADASDAAAADFSEGWFEAFVAGASDDDEAAADKVGAVLEKIRTGVPIADLVLDLPKGVRFHVLGLAPNAARVSVRFWITDDFGEIGKRYLQHLDRLRIDPPPKDAAPSMWRMLIETATLRKSENIAPNLAGEWLRAILTGAPYPATLLTSVLMRLRADHDVNALRVAILKSVLIRNLAREVPVSLDPGNRDPGYLLGRLFAAYEYAQTQALPGLNATIRDKFWGTASATPRSVFPALQRGATHHLAKLRKEKPGLATVIDRRIGDIFEAVEPTGLFVPTLAPAHQALFAVGYYHQKNDFYRPRSKAEAGDIATEETTA